MPTKVSIPAVVLASLIGAMAALGSSSPPLRHPALNSPRLLPRSPARISRKDRRSRWSCRCATAATTSTD